MLRHNPTVQNQYEFVCIEDLVLPNHPLRKIQKHIDFSFILNLVRPYYCEDNGRPSADPVMLFKMLFIGYMFGIRSERQLEMEVHSNVAYRWFLGLGLTDRVPDHSTLSYFRERLRPGDVLQKIFDEVVMLAIKHRLVAGRVLITDSTHLKANANKRKFIREQVTQSTKAYMTELDEAIRLDREANGKKPLRKREEVNEEQKEIKVSTTDPDSGYMVRNGKPEGFFYLDHRTVDHKYNIITDVHITPGNVHDSVPYIDRLEHIVKKFGFEHTLEAVALDAGYFTSHICKKLHEKNLFAVIGTRAFTPTKGLIAKWRFKYDAEKNVYICPQKHELKYSTTDRHGYRQYKSDPAHCAQCPMLKECTRSKNKTKVITRHVWQTSKEWVRANGRSKSGKYLYRLRYQTIERSFADAKELHGLRYCRFRGREKVLQQVLMTATCQNIKKIANILDKRAG